MRFVPRIASVAVALAMTIVAFGCGQQRHSMLGPANQPPTVTLTSTAAGVAAPGQSLVAVRWTGSDPDGRIDHYLITQDPRLFAGTSGWSAVSDNARLLTTGRASRAHDEQPAGAVEPTFFAVRAVDDRGAVSSPAVRAFIGDNVAPTVEIVNPRPSSLTAAIVPPSTRITWQGNDPDGAVPGHLAKYKFKLYAEGDPEYALGIARPDSLRRLVAPAFAGWDSVPGDTLGHDYSGLIPNRGYLFVVVGYDDQGAYSPVFSLDVNMLRMRVAFPESGGPKFTISGGGIVYVYPTGGFLDTVMVHILAPAREPVTVSWDATPMVGTSVVGYRWAVDIVDVVDETPRLGPLDLRHWSAWSATAKSAVVSPLFPLPASLHRRLYIEARDSNGFMSLAVVGVDFIRVHRDRELLVVLDTRLQREAVTGGGGIVPIGAWPNAAELDSFLFARGGAPMIGYPTGATSTSGLFTGYDYDVYRTMTTALDKTVPLDVLLRYRNVAWIVDANAGIPNPPGGQYALRFMCAPGRQNTLAAYMEGGGRLWLLGGGAALAMSKDLFNRTSNDVYAFTYSSAAGELVPGRGMYDFVHWRSEFSDYATTLPPLRMAVTPRPLAPDYTRMPAALDFRGPATDAVPPGRTPSIFFPARPVFAAEYLTQPNAIVEGFSPWPGRGRQWSVLDSLYAVRGVYPQGQTLPAMTVYRGHQNGMTVFTGFDLWSWRRTECRAMVDAVLGDLWHLHTTTEAPGVAVSENGTATGQDEGLVRPH